MRFGIWVALLIVACPALRLKDGPGPKMSTICQPNPLDRRVSARPWTKRSGWRRGATLLGLTVLWFARCALASEDNATGKVEGTALVPSPHCQAYVAGAKVVVSGPGRMVTETN